MSVNPPRIRSMTSSAGRCPKPVRPPKPLARKSARRRSYSSTALLIDIVVSSLLCFVPPPKKYGGVTHWSSRLLADHLKIGNATVARAWRKFGVQPWRAGTFKFSTDPELVAKVTDVVGVVLGATGQRDRVVC